MAGSLFTHSPLQGQVNLLTTGAFDNARPIAAARRTRGVAYFSVGAPVGGHGDWTVKAALNQGDLSSWILAGNYVTRRPARHQYQFGMSYGVHRYEGGNPAALAAMPDAARNVGAVYAHDEWTLSERLTLGYGAHYAHYDYLLRAGASQPAAERDASIIRQIARAFAPSRRGRSPRRARKNSCRRTDAQVLPPQRTFAPLTRTGFLPEDLRHYEVVVEQLLDGATVGVRAFQQTIDDQLVTVFGLRRGRAAGRLGHYFVGSAGDVDVRGWGVTFTHALADNVRGSVDYSFAAAEWANQPSRDRCGSPARVPSALRDDGERIHDFTTSLETGVPQSATRVFLLYKMNSAYIARRPVEPRPRRPLGHAGQPGPAVHEFHERRLGDARRRPKPVPRSVHRNLGLRRTAGRPPAQAPRRRHHRQVLTARRAAGPLHSENTETWDHLDPNREPHVDPIPGPAHLYSLRNLMRYCLLDSRAGCLDTRVTTWREVRVSHSVSIV